MERDLLSQQTNQILDLIGLLTELLLLTANISMLFGKKFIRLLSIIKQLVLSIHILNQLLFNLLEIISFRKKFHLLEVVLHAGLLA